VASQQPRLVPVGPSATQPAGVTGVETVPLGQRSGLGRKLASGELLTTVEILPPKGWNPAEMIEQCRLLQEAGVDAVNILDSARAQNRMGVLSAALIVQREVGLETVFHYTCRDRNMLGMLSDLLGAAAGGLRNVLIVTGDPPAMGPYPDSTAVFDIDSIGLTNLVRRLNQGLDPGGNPIGEPTRFVVGVALNQGADLERELERFAWKVEAGADFAVTQPVFDAEQLERFLGRVRAPIPIVAGIWPLASLRNAEFLANEVPGVQVPQTVLERMRVAQEHGTAAARAEGVAIAAEMVEAVKDLVQGVQVTAPAGRIGPALDVLAGLRVGKR
jgi:homocysteine S-methyltransferase